MGASRIKHGLVVSLLAVFGAACGDGATGPDAETWDVEVHLRHVQVQGSCDTDDFFTDGEGTGAPGEFVFQVAVLEAGRPLGVIAESRDYPDRSGSIVMPLNSLLTAFAPFRTTVTVPFGESRDLSVTFNAREWDGFEAVGWRYDPRLGADLQVVNLISTSGFSPGRHDLVAGLPGCKVAARLEVTAAVRGSDEG